MRIIEILILTIICLLLMVSAAFLSKNDVRKPKWEATPRG